MMVTHNGVKVSLGLITIARVLYNNNYGLNNFDRERGVVFTLYYIIIIINFARFSRACAILTELQF